MSEKRELEKKDTLKVVTSNNFITANGLSKMGLRARKLLYIAASQCRMNDEQFYEFQISIPEFSELMGVDPSNVYREAYEITGELASAKLTYLPEGAKKFKHIPVTSICEYDEDNQLRIELNKRMTDFLLQLKGSFTQPLLADFMKMRSPYSMAIWHLMQREMHSHKPNITNTIEFDLSLEELREVTGTQDKLKQLGQFKERCFDKALREIDENCGVKITYENIKKGRTVVGFRCFAVSVYHIDENKIPQKVKDRARLGVLRIQSKQRELTPEEREEYDLLVKNSEQMELTF